MNFQSTARDVHLVAVLYNVPRDASFQLICRNYCRMTTAQVREFNRVLTDSLRLRLVADYVIRCGWIGEVVVDDVPRIGLALPRRWPAFLLMTVAIHEVFHLVRDITGEARFCDERARYVLDPRRMWKSFYEEWVVWRKTARVDQVGSLILLTPMIAFPIMYGLFTVYVYQHSS